MRGAAVWDSIRNASRFSAHNSIADEKRISSTGETWGIAVAEIVTGISGVPLGTLLTVIFQNSNPISVFPALSDLSPAAAVMFLSVFGTILAILGTLEIVAGLRVFQGKTWAWLLGMGVNGALEVLSFIWLYSVSTLTGLPGVLVALLIIYYLRRPEVREFFGRS